MWGFHSYQGADFVRELSNTIGRKFDIHVDAMSGLTIKYHKSAMALMQNMPSVLSDISEDFNLKWRRFQEMEVEKYKNECNELKDKVELLTKINAALNEKMDKIQLVFDTGNGENNA